MKKEEEGESSSSSPNGKDNVVFASLEFGVEKPEEKRETKPFEELTITLIWSTRSLSLFFYELVDPEWWMPRMFFEREVELPLITSPTVRRQIQ